MRGIVILVILLSLSLASTPAYAQSPGSPPGVQSRSQYFSGFVASVNSSSITVTRKANTGKSSVSRVFRIDAQTKVEGKLRSNARVTVRFEVTAQGDRAVHIIVRG